MARSSDWWQPVVQTYTGFFKPEDREVWRDWCQSQHDPYETALRRYIRPSLAARALLEFVIQTDQLAATQGPSGYSPQYYAETIFQLCPSELYEFLASLAVARSASLTPKMGPYLPELYNQLIFKLLPRVDRPELLVRSYRPYSRLTTDLKPLKTALWSIDLPDDLKSAVDTAARNTVTAEGAVETDYIRIVWQAAFELQLPYNRNLWLDQLQFLLALSKLRSLNFYGQPLSLTMAVFNRLPSREVKLKLAKHFVGESKYKLGDAPRQDALELARWMRDHFGGNTALGKNLDDIIAMRELQPNNEQALLARMR